MVAILQSVAGVGPTLVMPGAIGAGHTLLFLCGQRGAPLQTPAGYTLGPDGVRTALNVDGSAIFTRTAGAGESLNLALPGGTNQAGWWAELDARFAIGHHSSSDSGAGFQNPADPGSIVAAAGRLVVAVVTEGTDGGWGAQTFNPLAGWTEQMDQRIVVDHPSIWVGSAIAPGGAIDALPVCTAAGFATAQIAELVLVSGLQFHGEPGGGVW